MIILALALALADEQTDCYRVGNTVHCNSTSSGGMQDYGAMIRNSRDAAPVYQPSNDAQFIAGLREQQIRKKVGALIAAGNCPEAEQVALKTGNLAFASEVKAYCAQ